MARPETIDSAEYSDKCGRVASADPFSLVEYSLHSASGEPEGAIFAEDAAEAAVLWAMENMRNGDGKLLQVFESSGWPCGWFEVRRESESATARECSV